MNRNNGYDNENIDSVISIESYENAEEKSTNSANSGYSSTSSCAPNTAVLPPILVSDARTRSYLIGNVGSRDSLLGSAELNRYFPNSKIKIMIITWNMSSRSAAKDLNDLLLPQSIAHVPDVYAIGVQEAPSNDFNEWQIHLQTTIGPSHVLFHSCPLGVLHLALYLRRDLVWFCSIPEEAVFNSRSVATNMLKTKGAIGISFAIFGTTFLFINCHFRAHENKLKHRIEEYEKICSSFDLPNNLKPLKPRYISKDVTQRFDYVFWFGDLNFRLEKPGNEVISIINQMNLQFNESLEILLQHDQLNKIMSKRLAFDGFNEVSSVRFPPTYKFKYGSNDYDIDSRRVPSYTDRILYRSKRASYVNCLIYDWITSINTSDHKPVFSLMEAHLRPGRDYALRLNVGSFNRDIYIEALKRRAIDAEDRNQSSLICNVM